MASRDLEGRHKVALARVQLYTDAVEKLSSPPHSKNTPPEHPSPDSLDSAFGALPLATCPSPRAQQRSDPGQPPGGVWGFLGDAVHRLSLMGAVPEEDALAGELRGVQARRRAVQREREQVAQRCVGGNVEDALAEELRGVQARRRAVQREREQVAQRRADLLSARAQVDERTLCLEAEIAALGEEVASCRQRRALADARLARLSGTHVANDAFHIWYAGALATINGFRVGRLPSVQVGWPEINAGLGQAAIALTLVAGAMKLKFSRYIPTYARAEPPSRHAVLPLGSFSRMAASNGYAVLPLGSFSRMATSDGRTLHALFSDEGFSLFPHRSLNAALRAFAQCVGEAGQRAAQRDPTLALPHRVDDAAGTVGGAPVALGSDLEAWTRAMKYTLTNLKWLLAWVAKYEDGGCSAQCASTGGSAVDIRQWAVAGGLYALSATQHRTATEQ
ncbi:autophagy protein Apg6-domain-containing protein [Tribonema minus]|uniref:Autophagy protein Apg6-domain-containing protein n=1 Tax=Tribonema minus TaxID=303371 RepID=A0A836CRQ0_9STRA|nr:autophagy protein Apg6-domain-containing protein [Tribonema minus]